MYIHFPLNNSFYLTHWLRLYDLLFLIYSWINSYSLSHTQPFLILYCIIFIFYFTVWCGVICLYINYEFPKYMIHTVEVDIDVLGWMRWDRPEKPIKTQSWLQAARTGQHVISLIEWQGHKSLCFNWRLSHVTINRARVITETIDLL